MGAGTGGAGVATGLFLRLRPEAIDVVLAQRLCCPVVMMDLVQCCRWCDEQESNYLPITFGDLPKIRAKYVPV